MEEEEEVKAVSVKLRPEAKACLLKGLRSGRYVKIAAALYKPYVGELPECCVMGVFNDVSGLGTWDGETYLVNDLRTFDPFRCADRKYISKDAWEAFVLKFLPEHPELEKYIRRDVFDDIVTPMSLDELSQPVRELLQGADLLLGEEEVAHDAVLKWAGVEGLDAYALEVFYNGHVLSLVHLNDGTDLTFEEMADIIEAQL